MIQLFMLNKVTQHIIYVVRTMMMMLIRHNVLYNICYVYIIFLCK